MTLAPSRAGSFLRSPTARVLVALVAGLAVGAAVAASGDRALAPMVAAIEPVGTLWLNAIRMVVVPLIVSLVVVGVASAAGAGAIGRLGWRGLLFFLALLVVGAATTMIVARLAFAQLDIDPASVASLRARVAGSDTLAVVRPPAPADLLVGIVPANPVKAAAEGTMLPLIVFALGLPIEGLAIVLAVDAIPDIFKTVINVTARLSAATVLARFG